MSADGFGLRVGFPFGPTNCHPNRDKRVLDRLQRLEVVGDPSISSVSAWRTLMMACPIASLLRPAALRVLWKFPAPVLNALARVERRLSNTVAYNPDNLFVPRPE